MIDFVITMTGTSALLMHNSRLVDPLDPICKAMRPIHSKQAKRKTTEDHETLARLEFEGSLYFDEQLGPFIPGQNIMACLVEAATLTRQGKQATRAVFIKDDVCLLAYKGPRTIQELYDGRYRHRAAVGVGQNRVMRTRPWFPDWAVEAEGTLDPEIMEFTDLASIAVTAGLMTGLGDWRPRFGRFKAEVTRR